jgi:hypothetical protein
MGPDQPVGITGWAKSVLSVQGLGLSICRARSSNSDCLAGDAVGGGVCFHVETDSYASLSPYWPLLGAVATAVRCASQKLPEVHLT